jgi:uncharacterized membrane protein
MGLSLLKLSACVILEGVLRSCVEVTTCELVIVMDCVAVLKADSLLILGLLLPRFELKGSHHIVRTKEQFLMNIAVILTF